MREYGRKDVEALVASYVPEFRERMLLEAEKLSDPDSLQEAMAKLEGPARDLAQSLIIGVGGGQPLPERFYERVDAEGEGLWLSGVLLPNVKPSKGSTIDPRYYTASSWVNPALSRVRPLAEIQGSASGEAAAAPSYTPWDARVVAVCLESEPLRVTMAGELRKDDIERLVKRLGGEEIRWKLAMSMARGTGMARVVGGRLHGFPAFRTRDVRDPIELLEGDVSQAAEVLLRIVGRRWVDLSALAEVLTSRCPEVLSGIEPSRVRESLAMAGCALQRFGRVEAIRDIDGVCAIRSRRGMPQVPPGILVTSDGEVLVVPGAISGPDFGRLCRMAPYQGGDVVYRHRLCRKGIAADLAAGFDHAADWIQEMTPTGLPSNMRELIRGWAWSAQRMSLWTGVTLIEEDGVLRRAEETPRVDTRFDYSEPCLGVVEVVDEHIRVDRRGCPLGLSAVLDRVLPREEATQSHWIWGLRPYSTDEPQARIGDVEARIEGSIPGLLEAAIRAAGGADDLSLEAAHVLHMAPEVLDALRRETRLSEMLQRMVQPGQVLVKSEDLAPLREALSQLGLDTK